MNAALLLALLIGIPDPVPGHRVLDQAAVISPEAEAELELFSRHVDEATTAEIAVVTVTSLEGMSVEEYANRLFNSWGIGKRETNNGVLLLVAPQERRVRIEVGYGLEPLLTDGRCGDILDQYALPAFRGDDYEAGIVESVSEIGRRLEAFPDAARGVRGSAPGPIRHFIGNSRGELLGAAAVSALAVGVTGFLSIFLRHRQFSSASFVFIFTTPPLALVILCLNYWRSMSFAEAGVTIFLTSLSSIVSVRKFLRYGVHRCPGCSGPMTLLGELEDDEKLPDKAKLEERLGGADWDVWVCPVCLKEDHVRYIDSFSKYEECPKCRVVAFHEASKTIRQPTYSQTGLRRIAGRCESCTYRTEREETIAQLTRSVSSSSSGGSFGGGSSGGGGASRSW